jgi:CRISPR-associated endoribonuclease Cas6
MRFRVDVSAGDRTMPWADVHGAARGVVYRLLREQDPVLATELHDRGWNGSSLRPVGVSPPLFRGAVRRAGEYTTSDRGSVWFGSPVPRIAAALLASLPGRAEIGWGGVPLAVRGVALESSSDFSSGEAVFESMSPVLVKHEDRFVLPDDPVFAGRLGHNLRHKADLLGLPSDVDVEVLAAGPRRSFTVGGALRVGATIRARVAAAAPSLEALYSWGLGLATNQGFGWLR